MKHSLRPLNSLLCVLAAVALLVTAACTDNQQAKRYGGTSTLTLPENRKLVNITWKEDHLWYLTKPMTGTDQAEIYEFKEKSDLGLMEGTYIIKEVKK